MRPLIDANIALLEEAARLIGGLDDQDFTTAVPGIPSLRVGGHLRHVLEFYECLLDGLTTRKIDYERRRRDARCETDRAYAVERIHSIADRLEVFGRTAVERTVWVRSEDAPQMELQSSVGRELQTLSSHTVHHYALIAATLKMFGIEVPEEFGVAPSTLRHRKAAA